MQIGGTKDMCETCSLPVKVCMSRCQSTVKKLPIFLGMKTINHGVLTLMFDWHCKGRRWHCHWYVQTPYRICNYYCLIKFCLYTRRGVLEENGAWSSTETIHILYTHICFGCVVAYICKGVQTSNTYYIQFRSTTISTYTNSMSS